MLDYSVLMPVYAGENPEYFEMAVQSMLDQTLPPAEFVLVCDGPLTDALEEKIFAFRTIHPIFHLVRFSEGHGIAAALRRGVQCCRHEWIARMDSDDIAVPNRIEKQMHLIENSSYDLALTSGTIEEFQEVPGDLDSYRRLPLQYEEICTFAKHRNPMNHMAVMMRKSAVLEAGNYRKIQGAEDYDLWVRMLLVGCKAENSSEVLVYARTGNGMQARRGGLSYARESVRLQKIFNEEGLLTRGECLRNSLERYLGSLLPGNVRGFIYHHTIRNNK